MAVAGAAAGGLAGLVSGRRSGPFWPQATSVDASKAVSSRAASSPRRAGLDFGNERGMCGVATLGRIMGGDYRLGSCRLVSARAPNGLLRRLAKRLEPCLTHPHLP